MTTSTAFLNNFIQYHGFFKNMNANSPINEHGGLKSLAVIVTNIKKLPLKVELENIYLLK